MAKPPKNRSAHVSPSSLTLPALLSVPATPSPTYVNPLDDPVILKQLHHGNYNANQAKLKHMAPAGDLRRFYPSDFMRPLHALKREATRSVIGNTPTSIRLADPDLVSLCLRRKARREVLHALRRTHLGKGLGRRRRRNRYSIISCK